MKDQVALSNIKKFFQPKDFDLRYQKSCNGLFGTPPRAKKGRRHSLSEKKKTKCKEHKSSSKTKSTPKNKYPPGTSPCPHCKRFYKIDIMPIHLLQCSLLRDSESIKMKLPSRKLRVESSSNSPALQKTSSTTIPCSNLSGNFFTDPSKFQFYSSAQQHQRQKIDKDGYSRGIDYCANEQQYNTGSTHAKDKCRKKSTTRKPETENEGYRRRQQKQQNFFAQKELLHQQCNSHSFSNQNMYIRYEHDWDNFEAKAQAVLSSSSGEKMFISLCEVPFPPKELNQFELVGFSLSSPCSVDVKRARVRAAMVRWHPDKFQQSFGFLLHPDEKDHIMEKVKESFQRINELKAFLP